MAGMESAEEEDSVGRREMSLRSESCREAAVTTSGREIGQFPGEDAARVRQDQGTYRSRSPRPLG